jgi:DNA-binding response OmpR family regulator
MPPLPPTSREPVGRAVLLVDDSRVARAAVEGRLASSGVDVVARTGCADAAAVDVGAVGAALLDLELADGTGVDVAVALRRRQPALAIGFLTSAPRSELAARAREIGPVFEKGADTAAAVAWAAAAAAQAGSGLGAAPDSG